MNFLVDVDNIIKQTKEIEDKELNQKEHDSDSQKLINPPKRNFWQRLFGKKRNRLDSLPRFPGDSDEELKKIIALRKQLGMDNLLPPTKPSFEKENISPTKEKQKITSDEKLSVFIEKTNSEPINIPSKDELQKLRLKLGLDKKVVNTKHLYDKLEEQSNKDLDKQLEQYNKEQSEIPEELAFESKIPSIEFQEQKKHEDLITSKYKEPLEIEDNKLFEKKLDFTQSTDNIEDDISFKQENSILTEPVPIKKTVIEKEDINLKKSVKTEINPENLVKPLKQENKKTEYLLSSNSDLFEEKQLDLQWPTKDQTIEKEFPEESAKILEDENFIISEPKTTENFIEQDKNLNKKITQKSEKELTAPKDGVSKKEIPKEEVLFESVDKQLKKTTNILEELERGEVPVEDLVHHLEIGVKQCNSMIEEKLFLEAKCKYNELCKVFEQTILKDDERTKWFGVLKKTYERIIEAERF